MTPRHFFCLLFLNVMSSFVLLPAYGQGVPGCTTPYYKGNYGPPLDGIVSLQSAAVGPDGSVYLGCVNYPGYAIMKLDSFGNMIRSINYTPSSTVTYPGNPGKTIVDMDGNLFSVIANDYILRTDTAGNVLSGKQLFLTGYHPDVGYPLGFLDVAMAPNGNKVFLFAGYLYGYEDLFVVETTPDASTILWTKYISAYLYGGADASMLVTGNKILLGIDITQSGYFASGSGIVEMDAGTGAVLQQRWWSQPLDFHQVSGYSGGYIFSGIEQTTGYSSFYIRTDTSLNIISTNYFPSYPIAWPNGFPFIFQAQPDGSVYGFYSGSTSLSLFLISAGDQIEWASGLSGFYQVPVAMALNPSGIFIGTDWAATDVVTGFEISSMQLYKSSYSGYFPPCTNPAPATMTMSAYPLPPSGPVFPFGDTSAFSISANTIQPTSGPTLTSSTCSGTPSCTSLHIGGNPNICMGSGTFTANTNGGCSLPITWSVTGGPGAVNIQSTGSNSVTLQFSQDGAYMLKALVNSNCTNFSDSLLVHVSVNSAHLSLGNDTLLCAGATLRLDAGSNFSSYTWQDGSTDSIFLVTAPGQYTVTTVDFCGNPNSSSVNVSFLPPLASPFPATVSKCPADTLSFALPAGFDSVYFISPVADARLQKDSLQFFHTGAATYSLQERDNHGCTVNSTIAVQVYPPPIERMARDTTICPGDSILLTGGAAFSSYLWSTGSRDQVIYVSGGGMYWLSAGFGVGCFLRDSMTLHLYPAPVVNLDPDTVLCTGTSRILSAGGGFTSYLWNDGSTASTLTISATGQYWVAVTDGQGCYAADTVDIKRIAPLPVNYLPGDTTICQYGATTLITVGDFSSYLWSDGSTAPSLTVHSPGLYYLQVTDKNGCVGKDSVLLTGKQCLIGFYIPNAFTPNNDGKNDVFRPLIYGNVVKYTFAIYNRWGQQVFVSTDPLKGWDGTIQGTLQPTGGYVWTCLYQLQGQEGQVQRGTVMLIR